MARRTLLALLLGITFVGALTTSAVAEFPAPAPSSGTDPYDYGAYMRFSTLPGDLDGKERWEYSSERACDLYGDELHEDLPDELPTLHQECDPIAEANPQELHQVTGASVDKAWRVTNGRPDVVIAVHDSGINWDDLGDMQNLNNKTWLNACELPVAGGDQFTCTSPTPTLADIKAHDVNADGVFNIKDYCENWTTTTGCRDARVTDLNGNKIIDPEDLIFRFSDGVDQGGNGYVDDFVGWDSYEDDNDPYDEVHYGHGSGEAYDSVGEANNRDPGTGRGGGVGTCPNCMVMHMRVGDSFVGDVNDFAQGVLYAADNGASVIQSALGTLNSSRFAQEAIDYAYRRGVVLIASAADESAGHHNQPSALEHAVTMNSSGKTALPRRQPHTFMEFRGCTNYGSYISATVPSVSCSSEAVGRSAGMVGLAYAAARNAVATEAIDDYGVLDDVGGVPAGVAPGKGISAEEVDQLIATTADDYNFTDPPYTDSTAPLPDTRRYGATPGWDPFFGYGRINARRIVEAIAADRIPPEADITSPEWFEIVDPDDGLVEVEGTVASRRTPAYSYEVQWATWSWRGERATYQPPDWKPADGVPAGNLTEPKTGVLATIDPADIEAELLLRNGPVGTDDGPAVDPATGRGEHENLQIPDKFGIIVRVVVTARDASGAAITTKYDAPDSGGDPNDDRDPEVPLVGVGTKNFNFHDDPALFPGFPHDMESDGAAAPRFADLDDDGKHELIVATSDGEVHAYKHGGGEAAGWPARTTPYSFDYDAPAYRSGEITTPVHAAVLRSPSLADLDRDGDLEVVVPDFEGRIGVFDKRGNRMLPPALGAYDYPLRSNPVYSSPQPEDRAADFYGRHPELVPGDYPGPDQDPATPANDLPNDPNLVPDLVNRRLDGATDHEGEEVKYEDLGSDDPNRTIWWMLPSPAIGNLDADDDLEILAGSSDGHVYQWDPDGTLRPGWPVKLRDPAKLDEADGDRIDPVTHMVQESDDEERLQGGPVIVSPALGDTDGDGRLDIYATVNEEYRETPNTDDEAFHALIQTVNTYDEGTLPAGNNRVYRLYRDGFLHQPASTDPGGMREDRPNHPHDTAYVQGVATPEGQGWPVPIASLYTELLPVVGEGPDGSPVIGDAVTDPGLEIGIYGTAGPAYVLNGAGDSVYGRDADGRYRTLKTDEPGGGNSSDTPTIPALGGAIFSTIGQGPQPEPPDAGPAPQPEPPTIQPPLVLLAPSAASGKLIDVALPEDQIVSDNQLGVWDLQHSEPGDPGQRGQMPGYPREVNDLQFLATPASADIDGDGFEEFLEGSAYSDLHAFKVDGDEPGMKTLAPDGWPKFTGGWTVAPPAVGDWDDDGERDIAHTIREGYLFVWSGNGAGVCDPATWPEYGHDNWMTNNVDTDATRPRVITDLTMPVISDDKANMAWTAPGEDGVCGQAHTYEIRRSLGPLTNENFDEAELVGRKAAGPSGTDEVETVTLPCGTYNYAVRTWDADPATDTAAHPANPSAISNVVSVTSRSAACRPAPPPGQGGNPTSPPPTTPAHTASITPTQTTSPPRGRAITTIASNKQRTRFQGVFTLSGQVTGTAGCKAPYDLFLQKRTHGTTAFRSHGTTISTGSSGHWRIDLRSRKSADWLVQVAGTRSCDGEASLPEDVLVRAGVTVRALQCDSAVGSDGVRGYTQLRVKGRVAPNHSGTKVRLERKRRGRWHLVSTDRLDRRSRFVVYDGRRCGGAYRVVWKKQSPENVWGQDRFSG